MSMFDFSGRVVLVTGSTKGIGKAIAARMAQAGAKVTVSSRKADACDAVTEEINSQWAANGGEAISIPAHAGKAEERKRLVDTVMDRWGKITDVVPNVGVNPYHGPMSGLPDAAFQKILDTNVMGTFDLCRLTLPQMVERGEGGSVTLIASIAGLKGSDDLGAYAISKVAEHQLARNLALENGPHGIRVNAIAPGLIKTDFAEALWTDPVRLDAVENTLPLRRLGDPDEVAGVALFLASDAGAYVTGQVINVCGGSSVV